MSQPEPAEETALILWDVVEEHLDEAGFCWSQWERALHSPLHRLDQVARKIEGRMLAHLDALLVGGAPVARRVLLPALSDADPNHVFAAASALLSAGDPAGLAAVVESLAPAPARMLPSLTRALEVTRLDATVQGPLFQLLESPSAGLRALGLDVLSFHRVDLSRDLPAALQDEVPAVQEAALRAAGRSAPQRATQETLWRLFRTQPEAPPGLLEVGMISGLPEASAACRSLVGKQGVAAQGRAQLLLAMLGGGADLNRLRGELEDPAQRKGALFAAGFTGDTSLVDLLLLLMREPDLAALAGEAMAGITGVDIEKDKLQPKRPAAPPQPEDDAEAPELADLDADLRLLHEADLPLPDPDLAAAWWRDHRGAFDPRQRYIQGLPFAGEETLLSALRTAPMRRRHALALELAVRSQGALQIETRALSAQQARHLPPRWQALAQPGASTNLPRRAHG